MDNYDKSYDALFRPGISTGFFDSTKSPRFYPAIQEYSHQNAWWLAEFCRLVYRIDDELKTSNNLSNKLENLTKSLGVQIAKIITHDETSSRAVVFNSAAHSEIADEPFTIIVFCGSNETLDWKMNLQALQDSYQDEARIHSGFKKCLMSLIPDLLNLDGFHELLFLTGHSLGGALATLMTVEFGTRKLPLQACYSFGSPRIGDQKFVDLLRDLPLHRIVNNCDVVTGVPVSLGANKYFQSDNGVFFHDDQVRIGMSDTEIQKRQLSYVPGLKKYLQPEAFLRAMQALSSEVPDYLADHAIINYRNQFAKHALEED